MKGTKKTTKGTPIKEDKEETTEEIDNERRNPQSWTKQREV